MRRALPSLNALRAFEVAARHNNFKLAADELRVTPAAVSYQIGSLETHLGVELFRRDNRTMHLTDAGRLIASGIADGFDRIAATLNELDAYVHSSAGRGRDREVLTIDVAPAFASKWLLPRLHKFTAKVPNVDVRILAKRELTDFADDGVDVAIRFGHGRYSDLRVEKLFDEAITPICSPRRMQSTENGLSNPRDLGSQILLHDDSYFFTHFRPDWDMWLKAANVEGIDTLAGPRFSLSELAVQASIEDCGIALGRLGLTCDDVASGRLVYPFDLIIFLDLGYYLVGPPKAFKTPKVEKLRAWLLDEAKMTAARWRKPARRQHVERKTRH